MDILHVDDHALFREGMELVLQRIDPSTRVVHAGTVAFGVQRLQQPQLPQLVLTDLNLPDAQGLDALLRLRAVCEEVPVVVLAASEDPGLVRGAIDHGASGYIPKASDSREVARALQLILQGGVYLPAVAMATQLRGISSGPSPDIHMTPRQRDVLLALVQGKPNKVIARELSISDATVKSHVAALFAALDVHNRTQAVYAVAQLGITLRMGTPSV